MFKAGDNLTVECTYCRYAQYIDINPLLFLYNDPERTVHTGIVDSCVPVSLPDVQRLLVHVVVSQRLLVQEVEEVLDGRRDDRA